MFHGIIREAIWTCEDSNEISLSDVERIVAETHRTWNDVSIEFDRIYDDLGNYDHTNLIIVGSRDETDDDILNKITTILASDPRKLNKFDVNEMIGRLNDATDEYCERVGFLRTVIRHRLIVKAKEIDSITPQASDHRHYKG